MGSICAFELWLARAYPAAHRQAKKTATVRKFSFITAGPAMSLPIRRGGSSGLLLGSSAAFQFMNFCLPDHKKLRPALPLVSRDGKEDGRPVRKRQSHLLINHAALGRNRCSPGIFGFAPLRAVFRTGRLMS